MPSASSSYWSRATHAAFAVVVDDDASSCPTRYLPTLGVRGVGKYPPITVGRRMEISQCTVSGGIGVLGNRSEDLYLWHTPKKLVQETRTIYSKVVKTVVYQNR